MCVCVCVFVVSECVCVCVCVCVWDIVIVCVWVCEWVYVCVSVCMCVFFLSIVHMVYVCYCTCIMSWCIRCLMVTVHWFKFMCKLFVDLCCSYQERLVARQTSSTLIYLRTLAQKHHAIETMDWRTSKELYVIQKMSFGSWGSWNARLRSHKMWCEINVKFFAVILKSSLTLSKWAWTYWSVESHTYICTHSHSQHTHTYTHTYTHQCTLFMTLYALISIFRVTPLLEVNWIDDCVCLFVVTQTTHTDHWHHMK